MAQSVFVKTADVRQYRFTQYVTSIATFQTAVDADFPELNGAEILHTTAAATVALVPLPDGRFLTVPLNSWLGHNGDDWEVRPNADMAGSVYHPFTP